MSNLVITISREHGSGGLYVGNALAEKLGIICYDSQLVTETAKESGFAPSFIAANEETKPSSFLYSLVMGFSSTPQNDPLPVQLYKCESAAIRRIAERESCIFIGRCADYILKDYEKAVHIFIHADLDYKINKLVEFDHLTVQQASKEIINKDKERSNYYEHFTGNKWGYAHNYDICIDTTHIGNDGAADLILSYLKSRNLI